MTMKQLARRLKEIENRYFGSDYVAARDAEDEEETRAKRAASDSDTETKPEDS